MSVRNLIEDSLAERLSRLDFDAVKTEFERNDEFIVIEELLPTALLNALLNALPVLEPHVHRNFIPGHKKGGSVSRYELDRLAPAYSALYRAPELLAFLCAMCGRELLYCPATDPHTYALYYYTEVGDHIGFHYDTSYYKGARYTVLIGLVDDSSCRIEYELFREDPARETQPGAIDLTPGTAAIFNSDNVYHRVSPCGADEKRVALTFEYVTNLNMHPFRRFVSNMKDAIAYFGFRQVFSGAKPKGG